MEKCKPISVAFIMRTKRRTTMLVLTRKQGEGLIIGDDIKIVILRHDHSGHVKIGIKAPKDMLILRCELEKRERGNE
jgi:carbon storage regulator